MSAITLEAVIGRLAEEHVELRTQIERYKRQQSELSGDGSDPLDRATINEERTTLQIIQRQLEKMLDHVNRALVRLAAGEYGYCEICGETIDLERLTVLPFATRCLPCQRQHEAGRLA